MKKIMTFCIGITCTSLSLLSCQDDLVETIAFEKLEITEEAISTKSLNQSVDTIRLNKIFFYEGRTYEYVITSVNDSVININESKVKELLIKFENNPNLVTYIHRDGIVEYFDNSDIFRNRLSGIITRENKLIKQERALLGEDEIELYYTGHPWLSALPPKRQDENQVANLWLFDDRNYDDTYLPIDLLPTEKDKQVKSLKNESPNLNDKVTSLVGYVFGRAVLFEVFEDSDFKDNSFCFTVYPGAATILKGDITYKGAWPAPRVGEWIMPDLQECGVVNQSGIIKRDTWNDRISSVRITPL